MTTLNKTSRRAWLTSMTAVMMLTTALAGCTGSGSGIKQTIDDANLGDRVGGGGLGDTLGGDEHTGEPAKGRFAVSGTWDLSSPLSAERTVGDIVTDALVVELAAHIPSERAVEKLDGLLRPVIKREVNRRAPAALKPDSELMEELTRTLASVEVVSELHLEDGGLLSDLRGEEHIVAFGFEKDGEFFQVTPEELPLGQLTAIETSWVAQARRDGSSLAVDDHRLELRFGALVLWLLDNVLERDPTGLTEQMTRALDCNTLFAPLLNDQGELEVEVAGVEYGFNARRLDETCSRVGRLLKDRALGMFALDARVEMGGIVHFEDEDGDGRADRLVSGEDFGGFVGVAPEFIAPRLKVSFVGERLE